MVQDSRLTSYQPEFDSLPPHKIDGSGRLISDMQGSELITPRGFESHHQSSCMPCVELDVDVIVLYYN